MDKVIIICNCGMSSSLIAKKVSDRLEKSSENIKVEATNSFYSDSVITGSEYKMILVSPQVYMYYDDFKKKADEKNKKIAKIPANSYLPTSKGIKTIEQIIINNISN